ncbi:MAG: ComF family protein [Proteobacteria bacterium]|nr:ComF family protein [Pseudomonadota bacterium]
MLTLPRRCALCATWCGAALCTDCTAVFMPPATPRCLRCATPTGLVLDGCGRCRVRPWPLAATRVGSDYAFPWDALVRDLKFHAMLHRAEPLAGLLTQRIREAGAADVDLVTALPLHASRLRARGYNQAWLIARRVARELTLPAVPDLLIRWRTTAPQTDLDEAQRQRNVAGAFMPAPAQAARIRGRRVALVDDVTTTGATACAAAQALLEAGAASVTLWAAVRTP